MGFSAVWEQKEDSMEPPDILASSASWMWLASNPSSGVCTDSMHPSILAPAACPAALKTSPSLQFSTHLIATLIFGPPPALLVLWKFNPTQKSRYSRESCTILQDKQAEWIITKLHNQIAKVIQDWGNHKQRWQFCVRVFTMPGCFFIGKRKWEQTLIKTHYKAANCHWWDAW